MEDGEISPGENGTSEMLKQAAIEPGIDEIGGN
jgi:hypothetical protein